MRKKTIPISGVLLLCASLLFQQNSFAATALNGNSVSIETENYSSKQTGDSTGYASHSDSPETANHSSKQTGDSSGYASHSDSPETANHSSKQTGDSSGYASRSDSLKAGENTLYFNLNEIILSASYIKERQSPLRLSSIDDAGIRKKGLGITYPELLRDIPGVYATSESGSYGDARINIRGFKQENISVLLNGIPISGLVTGNMFWNNWLGLTDATHSIQVQKGIGASMLSDNSVGGTINIITKTTDVNPSASGGLYMTSYGQMKSFISLNSGEIRDGWAASAMVSYAWGEAYADVTDVSSWAYMVNVSKRFNNRNSLLLTALGSPERHQQRSVRLSLEEVSEYGLKYNKNWGYLNGKKKTISENFYHKPYLTLHHFYNNGKNIEGSNSVYLSVGNGGGRWSESKGKRIIDYRKDGLIDWSSVIEENRNTPDGGSTNILSDFLAGHTQTGIKSNLKISLTNSWTVESGVHYQHYSTWEKEKITDLLGGEFWYEDYAGNSLAGLAGRNPVKSTGDYVRTNNGKIINHLTLYSMVYFKDNQWDIRLGLSGMGSTNQRWDKYNYPGNIYSGVASAAGYSVKGGALRKISAGLSVYLNVALYSRVPYNDLFFAAGNNNITDNVRNENNILAETGFRYLFQRGSIEVTGYYAKWKNKSIISNPYKQPDNTNLRYLLQGLDALHYGIEAEAAFRPWHFVNIGAFASFGNWRWKNDVSANIYDNYSGLLKDVINVYSNGLPVGDSPQTQLALSTSARIAKNIELNADWKFFGRMYADFDPKDRRNPDDRALPYKTPDYTLLNAGISWNITGRNYNTTLFLNVNNLLDEFYIERGRDGADHTAGSFRGFWGAGRYLNAGVRFEL